MNLRTAIRDWLGIDTDYANLLVRLAQANDRITALESAGLRDIRSMATIAQGLPETDPRRQALSDATNDYLVRKMEAEDKVRQHFGYTCQRHHNDGYNACTYCDAALLPGTNEPDNAPL